MMTTHVVLGSALIDLNYWFEYLINYLRVIPTSATFALSSFLSLAISRLADNPLALILTTQLSVL